MEEKYNQLFNHIVPNQVDGIIIYTSDDKWSIKQDYNHITPEEHMIWGKLYETVYEKAYNYGHVFFKNGLDIFNKNCLDFESNVPNLNDISKIIFHETLWKIKPVAGFVDESIFFKLLSESYFPSSDIIRFSNRFNNKYKGLNVRGNLSYTPEPDIFHEIFGHAPFLLNNKYCQLLRDIGRLGCNILENMEFTDNLKFHNLKRLQNFVWWTLEFGLIAENINTSFEILGSGILSSIDEINNVIKSIKYENKYSTIIKYDIENVVFTCFDYSNLQDRYYYIESFDYLYNSFSSNIDIFLFKGD